MENNDQLIDIYDIWYKPFWKSTWFLAIVTIIACILLGYIFFYVYKKYLKKQIVIDPVVLALYKLAALKKMNINTEQDSKDCYFRLSSIIKEYLAFRYDSIFIQLTDKELINHAEPYLSNDHAHMLKKLMQEMSFIKFEHKVVGNEKLKKDIETVQNFIEYTTAQHGSKEA